MARPSTVQTFGSEHAALLEQRPVAPLYGSHMTAGQNEGLEVSPDEHEGQVGHRKVALSAKRQGREAREDGSITTAWTTSGS